MSVRRPVAETLGIPIESVSWSFLFVLGTLFVYATSAAFEILPPSYSTVYAIIFVVFWLGYPVALSLDVAYVDDRTGWDPPRWYYLGVLPSYFGLAFVVLYVLERRNHLA